MKNRKTVIVAFMLIAAMLLAVGYAALTVDLFIGGNATVNAGQSQDEFEGDIYFDEVDPANDIVTYAANPAAADTATRTSNTQMTIGVNSLSLADEYVEFTFTVVNESLHEVELSIEEFKIMGTPYTEGVSGWYEGDEWIEAKVEWAGGSNVLAAGVEDINGDITPSTKDVTFTFKLLKNPTAQIVRSINVTIDATTTD